MSDDQSEEPPLPDNLTAKDAPGLEDNSDNMNLFASVWVKIEVNDDDDDEIQIKSEEPKEQPPRTPLTKRERKKIEYKKRSDRPKNIKCDLCDYKTNQKSCLAVHILGHSDNKPFICTHCDYKTKYPVSLKRHILVQHPSEDTETQKQELMTHKCNMCPYTTHFKWNLSSHQRKHDLAKQYKCLQCGYTTAYKHNHLKHSRRHTKPEESTYYCDKCPFATKYEGHIIRHLAKVHFEVSEKASRCENCPFSTKTKWRLNVHRNRSRQEKPVRCAHCDFQTLYRCAYREHKLTHTDVTLNSQWLEGLFATKKKGKTQDVKDFDSTKEEQAVEIRKMCEYRSKLDNMGNNSETTKTYDDLRSTLNQETYYTFNDNPPHQEPIICQLSKHEKNNDYIVDPACEVEWASIQVIESPDQDRPFQCIGCNYKAKFKASVQRHYQRHHTSHNRPYKCVKCDFTTKTKDQIALHSKRSKSDEILTCKICPYTTVYKCQFVMHEKSHCPFKCVYCEYACKKKYEIQKHFTMVHLGNGLKCTYCNYRATRKESLLCHEAIHTGEKPFKCHLCGYNSVRRSLLENHLYRFHKTKVPEKIINHSKIESLKKKNENAGTDTLERSELIEKMENYYYTTDGPAPVAN